MIGTMWASVAQIRCEGRGGGHFFRARIGV